MCIADSPKNLLGTFVMSEKKDLALRYRGI